MDHARLINAIGRTVVGIVTTAAFLGCLGFGLTLLFDRPGITAGFVLSVVTLCLILFRSVDPVSPLGRWRASSPPLRGDRGQA